MKYFKVLFLILFTYICVYAETKKEIKFDTITFEYAFSDKSGVPVEEYVDKGKTLKNWQYLLAYRYYEEFNKPADVIKEYLKVIKPTQEPAVFAKDKENNDIILVFLLIAPDKSYVEFNIHRFVLENKIVRSYQFARKATESEINDLNEEIKSKKSKWLEEIGKLKMSDFNKE